ncbi:MAG: acetamidase/formamidase family protein, partial [Clostridia bacterium]
GLVHFDEQRAYPIKPMIGVIGVSPAEGTISTVHPGAHGGNLDCKEITEGATIYLPVFVPGGKLALGDFHALMGDGEVAASGVEIGGRVQLHVELIKGVSEGTPVVEDEDHFYVLYTAQKLDEACEKATEAMFRFLQKRMPELEPNDIVAMMGIVGDIRISQMVNPLRTGKFVVPKSAFPVEFQVKK